MNALLAVARTTSVAALLLVLCPGGAQAAGGQAYCLQTPGARGTVACPTTFPVDRIKTSVSAVNDVIKANGDAGRTGDSVVVMPGTYADPLQVWSQADVRVFGDPASTQRPVLSTTGGAPTIDQDSASPGLVLQHLQVEQRGTTGIEAIRVASAITVQDVAIRSRGAGLVTRGEGPVTLTKVSAAAVEPTQNSLGPVIGVYDANPLRATDLTVDAPGRPNAVILGNVPAASIDGLDLTATTGPDGGATAFNVSNSNLVLEHATIQSGGAALAAAALDVPGGLPTARVDVRNSRLVSAGTPNTVADRYGYARSAVFSFSRADVRLRNVTAVIRGDKTYAVQSSGTYSADGVTAAPASMTVTNSILRGGAGDATILREGGVQDGSLAIDHSNYRPVAGDGVTAGAGNQSGDPLFADLAAGDLHVREGSPTLRAGVAVPAGETDLDRAPRPDVPGTAPDLGAYESRFGAPAASPPVDGTPPGEGPPTTTTTAPGVGTTPPPPSNVFSVASQEVDPKTGKIAFVLIAPRSGTFKAAAKTKLPAVKKKGRRKAVKAKVVKLAAVTKQATQAGRVTLTVAPSAAVKKALAGGKRLKVSVTLTFTPAGAGAVPKSVTRSVSVKLKKARRTKRAPG